MVDVTDGLRRLSPARLIIPRSHRAEEANNAGDENEEGVARDAVELARGIGVIDLEEALSYIEGLGAVGGNGGASAVGR